MDALGVRAMWADAITAICLVIAAAFAFATTRHPDRARALPAGFALVAVTGLCMLAIDEWFAFHERLGSWLWEHGVEAPGPVRHVDDLVIMAYALAAIAICVFALPSLVRKPRFLGGLVFAALILAVAVVFDALESPGTGTELIEEFLEAAGAVALAIVFAAEALQLAPIARPLTAERAPQVRIAIPPLVERIVGG